MCVGPDASLPDPRFAHLAGFHVRFGAGLLPHIWHRQARPAVWRLIHGSVARMAAAALAFWYGLPGGTRPAIRGAGSRAGTARAIRSNLALYCEIMLQLAECE